MWAFNILERKWISQLQGRRCLRISYSAGFLFSLFSLTPVQFPNRCHLLWCCDIRKILMPKLYRPCMLLKHSGNRLQLESPHTEFPAEPLESSQPPCLPWAVPPQLWAGHLQAPWYCTLTLQQPACSAADCCLTGDVLASRGPSRWVPRHCRSVHSLLDSKEEWAKGVKRKSLPWRNRFLSVSNYQAGGRKRLKKPVNNLTGKDTLSK